tara:strand:+ start:359 stop:595 length:237 start_codon:yes stop_codon:yes gene_type:complete
MKMTKVKQNPCAAPVPATTARPISIVDDGTLDTVVDYRGEKFRFDSEYRSSYESESDFLEAAREDIEETLAQHKDLRQ